MKLLLLQIMLLANFISCGSSDSNSISGEIEADPLIATQIEAGRDHTCALVNDGDIFCWGRGDFGQLGLGNTDDVGDDELPNSLGLIDLGGAKATQLSSGSHHTCALLTDGNVRCWGDGSLGQLGLGNTDNIGDDESPTSNVNLGGATVTQIIAGDFHNCALLSDGSVRCWGWNQFGQLGLSNTDHIGDDETPTTSVNLGGAIVTQIAAGGTHTCALLTGGCWGRGVLGALGLGNGDNIGDDESPTVNVNLGGEIVTHMTAGSSHNCVTFSSGGVRCWGSGGSGILGIESTATVGLSDTPTINVNLGGATVAQMAAGIGHTCALLSDGNVRCWGLGTRGRLGLGNVDNIGDDESPTVNVDLLGMSVSQVTANGNHTCVLMTDGSVRCWGDGSRGQLGLGNTNDIGDDETPGMVDSVQVTL